MNPFKKSEQPSTKSVTSAEKTSSAKVDSKSSTASETVPETVKIDLTKPNIKEAIAQGKVMIKDGKSKADAARLIYSLLKDEDKNLIVAAFVAGATLTEKGALTYWYNCKRKQANITPKI